MTDLDEWIEAPDWSTLLPHLEGLTDEACRSLAPRLARFPDASRVAPKTWIDKANRGASPPALQLCRSLHLAHHRFEEDDEDGEDVLDRLLRRPALAGLTRLTLGMNARGLTVDTLAGLAALRELWIETTEAFTSALRDEQLAAIAMTPSLGHLTLLSLERVDLRGPGVAALARSSTLTALTTLELYAPARSALCKALAGPAPALRGVRRLALCADRFTNASAAALAGADDLLAGLTELEFRVDESSGFDWAETFSGDDGARNARRFAGALARLLPALHDCEQVTITYSPRSQVRPLARADFAALARDPRALRAAFPPRMTAG